MHYSKFSKPTKKPIPTKAENLLGKASVFRSASKSTLTLLITLLISPMLLTGCDPKPINPLFQTIPTDVERWEDKLGETLEQLPEQDRQLLSRYMVRMRLSDAYEKGAMPRITVGKALEQQRRYEILHPNNPTGRKSPVSQNTQQQQFSFSLLPAQTSESDSLNNVELSFILTNNSNSAITGFKGTLLMRYPAFKKPKPVVIALTKFDPPIAPKNTTKLVADVSISDPNVMTAIQNPSNIEIVVTKGRMTFEDGREIQFD